MTSDGSEYRFWVYADTANENRYVSDTGSVFELRLNTAGQVAVYTKRTAAGYAPNAYTAVGTYSVGWTEYRVVLDFTATPTRFPAARLRRRTLDAAEVHQCPHTRDPHARGHRPHHDGQPALPRLHRRRPVDRRRGVLDCGIVEPTPSPRPPRPLSSHPAR